MSVKSECQIHVSVGRVNVCNDAMGEVQPDVNPFSAGTVFRRQNLTSEVDSCTKIIKKI